MKRAQFVLACAWAKLKDDLFDCRWRRSNINFYLYQKKKFKLKRLI